MSKDARLQAIRRNMATHTPLAEVQKQGMATLAGIAYLLASRLASRLQQPEPLKIAIFGYNHYVIGDQGRALQLIRGLLKPNCELTFDVVVDRLRPHLEPWIDPDGPSSYGDILDGLPAARFFASYDDYDPGVHKPEVAIGLYPDWIDETDDIVATQWPFDFIQLDLPVMGMCFDDFDQDTIYAVVRGHGLGTTEIFESPVNYTLDDFGQDIHLGKYLFAITPSTGNKGMVHESGWLHHARELRNMRENHRSRFDGAPPPGTVLTLGGTRVAFGTDDRSLDLTSGQAYRIRRLDGAGIELEAMPFGPDEDWNAIDPTRKLRRSEVIHMVHSASSPRLMSTAEFNEARAVAPELLQELLNDAPPDRREALEAFLNSAFLGESGVTAGLPIFVATTENDVEGIKAAISNGADVNAKDTEGWTPLAEAAGQNCTEAASFLLEAGADPNIPTTMGHYPVTIALIRGHDAAALALLKGGADPSLESVNGMSAAQWLSEGMSGSPALISWWALHGK